MVWTPYWRELAIKYYVESGSCEEAASALDLSVRTVRSELRALGIATPAKRSKLLDEAVAAVVAGTDPVDAAFEFKVSERSILRCLLVTNPDEYARVDALWKKKRRDRFLSHSHWPSHLVVELGRSRRRFRLAALFSVLPASVSASKFRRESERRERRTALTIMKIAIQINNCDSN